MTAQSFQEQAHGEGFDYLLHATEPNGIDRGNPAERVGSRKLNPNSS